MVVLYVSLLIKEQSVFGFKSKKMYLIFLVHIVIILGDILYSKICLLLFSQIFLVGISEQDNSYQIS